MSASVSFLRYALTLTGRANGLEAIGEYLPTKSVWCELSERFRIRSC